MKLTAFTVLTLFLFGCGAKTESNSNPAPPPPAVETNASFSSGNPLTAPVDYLGAVAKARGVAERTADADAVGNAIQLFQAQEDRFPKDLDELVAAHYLPSLPALPPGTHWEYNPARGQVRVVKSP